MACKTTLYYTSTDSNSTHYTPNALPKQHSITFSERHNVHAAHFVQSPSRELAGGRRQILAKSSSSSCQALQIMSKKFKTTD